MASPLLPTAASASTLSLAWWVLSGKIGFSSYMIYILLYLLPYNAGDRNALNAIYLKSVSAFWHSCYVKSLPLVPSISQALVDLQLPPLEAAALAGVVQSNSNMDTTRRTSSLSWINWTICETSRVLKLRFKILSLGLDWIKESKNHRCIKKQKRN